MNYKMFLAFTFACLTFIQVQAENSMSEQNSGKIYVHSSDIYLSNHQIFIQTPKGLIQVDALMTDSLGIYYKAEHPYFWVCASCNTDNAYTYYCENCGKSEAK